MQSTSSPARPSDPGRSASRPQIAGRKLTKEERLRNVRIEQELQNAIAICDDDIRSYSLIFEGVLKNQVNDLVQLEKVVARIDDSLEKQAYAVVQPPMDGCESATSADYLELLKMEFEDWDDTIYHEARAVAESMGLAFRVGPHKKNDRAMEKARLAYRGRYDLLKDLRRASIVCPDIATVCTLVEYIADISKSGLQVVRIKNRFARSYNANKESAGYRDLQFNVLVPKTQLIWELQVHLKDIEALKTKLRDQADPYGRTGHQRYVAFRTITERIKDKEEHASGTSRSSPDTHVSAEGSGSNGAVEAPKIDMQQQQMQMQQQMQQMGQTEKEQKQKMEQLERALEEERSRAKAAEKRAEQEAANAKMASEAKKAAEAEKKRAEQEAAEARNAAAKAEEASAKQEAATTAAGTNAMLLAPSEARAAARAALGAQKQSELDKKLWDDLSKGDRGKVKDMLDRGADPNGYKVRRT